MWSSQLALSPGTRPTPLTVRGDLHPAVGHVKPGWWRRMNSFICIPNSFQKCTKIKGPVYIFDKMYPVPAFCFEVSSPQSVNDKCKEIYKLIEHLLKNCIAHNIFITRGSNLVPGEQNLEIVRVIIWPRKSSPGPKILTAFYVALCELSGWFPVYCEYLLR